MRIGKRRIKMPAVAVNAVAHGALEGGIGPCADAGLGIGRDVGAVDGAERRLEGPAAGIDDAARRYGRPRSRRARPVAGRGRWWRPNRPTHRAARSARSTRHGSTAAAMPTIAAQTAAMRRQRAASVWQRDFASDRAEAGEAVGAGRQRRSGHRVFAAQSRQNTFRRERQFAKPHAGRVKDRVGDRRGARNGCGFADAERRLILSRQHQDVDLREHPER